MKKKVVLINGAPNSGKDTVAVMLLTLLGFGKILSFKDELYKLTAQMFGIELEYFKKIAQDRDLKEKKTVDIVSCDGMKWYQRIWFRLKTLFGIPSFSPRDALIFVSENIVKPKLGQKYFGKKLAEAVLDLQNGDEEGKNDYIFVPDSGFLPELQALLDAGLEVVLIRIHREGTTFDNDSRSSLTEEMLEPLGVKSYDIYNDGSLADLEEKALDILVNKVIRGE